MSSTNLNLEAVPLLFTSVIDASHGDLSRDRFRLAGSRDDADVDALAQYFNFNQRDNSDGNAAISSRNNSTTRSVFADEEEQPFLGLNLELHSPPRVAMSTVNASTPIVVDDGLQFIKSLLDTQAAAMLTPAPTRTHSPFPGMRSESNLPSPSATPGATPEAAAILASIARFPFTAHPTSPTSHLQRLEYNFTYPINDNVPALVSQSSTTSSDSGTGDIINRQPSIIRSNSSRKAASVKLNANVIPEGASMLMPPPPPILPTERRVKLERRNSRFNGDTRLGLPEKRAPPPLPLSRTMTRTTRNGLLTSTSNNKLVTVATSTPPADDEDETDDEDNASSSVETPSKKKQKKSASTTSTTAPKARQPRQSRQVKVACSTCKKACKRCDEARPCSRCVRLGKADTCVNAPRKERARGYTRGPYKKAKKQGDEDGDAFTGSDTPSGRTASPFSARNETPEHYAMTPTENSEEEDARKLDVKKDKKAEEQQDEQPTTKPPPRRSRR
ncbi:hypothetical protein SmJEL517_g05371 [Synchytrium microbalum]|uniref:Zn(2)-C6 fungal-type domain-containing protein n=1 Tax=Synchytrium microbalum TaxID=1806994 RepID=A0A507C179_9FUNG|nr:uncharacterized protein SmJEL517_g05371 [Synchytrium microbalum]TPX31263.1 hypothetical protein SmJEL517_g05371 [Synchytrium microbalum]